MTETVMPPELVAALKPEYVDPLVGYLCHDSCKETGGLFEVGAGWIAKLRWERTKGVAIPLNHSFTPDTVAKHWAKINDWTDSDRPQGGNSSLGIVMSNLETAKAAAAAESKEEKKEAPASDDFASTAIFNQMIEGFKTMGEKIVPQVGFVIQFNLTKGDKKKTYTVDAKNGKGGVTVGPAAKADATFTVSDDDFVALANGKANPQNLFMQQKIKLSGNMAAAMKFGKVLESLPKPAKL